MNIDYERKKKKPVVNADYVYQTSDRHFPGIRALLEDMKDLEYEAKRAEAANKANRELETILSEERQKRAEEEVLRNMKENNEENIGEMKSHVVQNILNVTDRYSIDAIENAVVKVFSSDKGRPLIISRDERALTRLTSKRLENRSSQPRKNKDRNPNAGRAIADYVFENNGDDELI